MAEKLDIVKHCVDASGSATQWWWGPLLTAGLTIVGALLAIRFDQRKAANQELIKKRLELYNRFVPMANDLYCYFRQVGNFKNFSPRDMLNRKRDLDAFIHHYGALFSSKYFTNAYFEFINDCFTDFHGWGTTAKLRVKAETLKLHFAEWDPAWDDSFDETQAVNWSQVEKSYLLFVQFFAWQIGARRRPWAWPSRRASVKR